MTVSKVQIIDKLRDRLTGPLSKGCSGALYGLSVDGVTVVVAAAGKRDSDGKKDLLLLNEVLPCGIEPVGAFTCCETATESEGLEILKQLPPQTQDDVIPVFIMQYGTSLKIFQFSEGELIPAQLEVITEKELNENTVTIRVRGKLDLTCGFTQPELALGFKHLIEKVTCPYGSYAMEGDQVIFLHKFIEKGPGTGWTKSTVDQPDSDDSEDCEIIGPVSSEASVEDLWEFTQPEEEDDGFGGKSSKGKKKVERKDRLEFFITLNLTNPACTSRTIGCAPIVHYEKKSSKTISLPIKIDALGVVSKQSKAKELMQVLKGCVARQVGDMAASVMSEFSLKKTVSVPQVHHFQVPSLPHLITIIYPSAADNETFKAYRKNMHESFMLPVDRPFFRKSNALLLNDTNTKEKLLNVHSTILDKHGVAGGQTGVVQGLYTYFHYMQDNFDDDGWGCAYRSLQTLISWFKQQGYTDTRVPTHREVQKCLVDIGDKESKFIGSKQWIGSTEVGFVLETACNIQSRFISVSSGAELHTKARDLIAHFEKEGTPVMIGGGVYAHTILGVAYDEPTDTCSWLILDPHYTGTDDLKTILSKGWCGWKTAKFWNQTAFYNMCLPQRPKNVI